MFSYKWRAKLAKCRFFIKPSLDLVKMFKADCNLPASSIQKKILFILGVKLSIVENEDRQREIDIRQNLVSVGGENEDTPQQNNPRRPKRKRDGEDEGSREARLEKIRTQATKAAVKKVKTATEKVQSTKVKKAATARDNAKRTLTTKTRRKKGELNEMPNTGTATQGDGGPE